MGVENTQISVIAPCFNEEANLNTFLDSLVNQAFKDFEVLIVDGGSLDRSREIIMQYQRKLNIKVYVNTTRNIGYVRDVAAQHAKAPIMFHTSCDVYFEPLLLERVNWIYKSHPNLISLAGRTFPLGTSLFAHLGYQAFDFLRCLFTRLPLPLRKYRPSGNFMTCRTDAYHAIGGYPHVRVNEDGLIGGLLDQYAMEHHKKLSFNLHLYVGHHVKKFEKVGGFRAIMFYVYALSNLFPMFKRLLQPFEEQAALVFEGKATLKARGFKSHVIGFWNWL